MSASTVPSEPLSKPSVEEGEIAEPCPKCNGTGFFCMGTENGKPFSFTGFDCHPCEGTGWIVTTEEAKAKAAKRAARAAEKAEEEREERALAHAMEEGGAKEIVADLLPRAQAIVGELKEDTLRHVEEFIERGERFLDGREEYMGQYALHAGWIKENIAPVVIRWEAINKSRAEEAAVSNFVGIPGNAIIVEATLTFVKSFESEFYGTRWITLMKDEHGNVLKYWNLLNFVDPIQTQAVGQEVKRGGLKGDKVKFKATVKEHEIYKGCKQTTLQRARKCELIKAGEANV